MVNRVLLSRRDVVVGGVSTLLMLGAKRGGAMPTKWDSIEQVNHRFPVNDSKVYSDYLEHYRILLPKDCQHFGGFIDTGEHRIFTQSFLGPVPKGNILLLHGYLDHSGLWGNWISELLIDGWNVCTIDLPGHGLSDGRRGHIDDFSIYQKMLDDILPYFVNDDLPLSMIGHSTGAAIIAEAVLRGVAISKSIFIAPLLKIRLGNLIGASTAILPSWLSISPGVYPRTTNPEFFEMRKADPLRAGKISMGWLKAAAQWRKRIQSKKSDASSVLLLQGDKDTVVDAKYNMVGYNQIFPHLEIQTFVNGRHHLLNDAEQIRRPVRDRIINFLNA